MTTKTKRTGKDYRNGEDCTALFDTFCCTVPTEWAMQEGGDAARKLAYMLIGCEVTPMEGTPGESVGFRSEVSGLGYTLAYDVREAETDGLTWCFALHVYRNTSWDAEPVADDGQGDDVDALKARVAELEAEVEKRDEMLRALVGTVPERVHDILEGGPEISERLDGRIQSFEMGLRRACHLSYALQHELADEGHVRYLSDGTACWAYGSRRMKNISDELEDIINRYFGGFNYPTD